MAFKSGTTNVISNAQSFQNGVYNNLHPALAAPSDFQINYNNPITKKDLTGNVGANAFTLVNGGDGKICTAIINRGTFSMAAGSFSGVIWANGTEPNWNSFAYWQITFTRWTDGNNRAIAAGFSS